RPVQRGASERPGSLMVRYARAMVGTDTAPEVRRRQLETYRAMTPERRVDAMLSMSEELRQITIEGIRTREASLDEEGVHRELLRILHGRPLAATIVAALPCR